MKAIEFIRKQKESTLWLSLVAILGGLVAALYCFGLIKN